MENYRMMYYILFNAITNALAAQAEGNDELVRKILITAQQNAEEIYVADEKETPAFDH